MWATKRILLLHEIRRFKVGAVKAIIIDAKEMFVKYFIFPAIQAERYYEGQYPLATALSQPLMAKLLVDTALAEGANAVALAVPGKATTRSGSMSACML
jgi:argininosuccinate synthase